MVKTASQQEVKIGEPTQLTDLVTNHEDMKKNLVKKGKFAEWFSIILITPLDLIAKKIICSAYNILTEPISNNNNKVNTKTNGSFGGNTKPVQQR